jgi:hypothetical protein
MPKVIIKEIDNSTTGIPASDNFAVVVPGYFGTAKIKDVATGERYDPETLLVENGVYEVRSQKDFVNYIGTTYGIQRADGIAPTLEPVNNISSANEYTRYHNYLRVNDFNRQGYSVYEIEAEIYSTTHLYGDLFGKNGYLLKSLEYTQTEEIKDPETGAVTDVNITKIPITIKLKKVTLADVELILDPATNMQITKSNRYCLIADGYEGEDEFDIPQMGNQIAYELLGLGYTVLYKRLDPKLSLDAQLEDENWWAPLKDKSVFNFRYIMTGGYYRAKAMMEIVKLADFINGRANLETSETLMDNSNGRGDCIALCDLDEDAYSIKSGLAPNTLATAMGTAAAVIPESPYAAIFAPKVTYVMDDDYVSIYNGNKEFPASFHYLACAAKAFSKYNEWYAVAGYTRGVSKYDVASTTVKIGEILVNTLAPRVKNDYTEKSINLILHERGNYYLWGNRTAKKLNKDGVVFHHFLNIRQLCCSIKKQLYTACRRFTFDPNSDLLWINFVNAIKPTLEAMRADQGIKGYMITRVANDKKALLTARIRIVPIEAVEDFDISIYLEDSLTGIVVNTDETQA